VASGRAQLATSRSITIRIDTLLMEPPGRSPYQCLSV
jgi:hypothetical protein